MLKTIFNKQTALVVQTEQPFNAGPPASLLRQSFITPRELFFVRNHGSVPEIDPASYRLIILGLVKKPLCLSLQELCQFPRTTITATLQCAGYRRKELNALAPIPGETPWDMEPIGTANWAGVALRDVLLAAGVEPEARHIAFTGSDQVQLQQRSTNFGGSIPLEKALQPEVLLAYEMNNDPLLPVHGFPLRVIVPGYVGARSVKWLNQIEVRATPSENYYQTQAYKLFQPHVQAQTAEWDQGEPLGKLPLNAVISQPREGQILPAGPTWLQGYALAGGAHPVERVELSLDQGATWLTVDLQGQPYPWAWRFWQIRLDLTPGPYQVAVRAWDTAGNTQPADTSQIWNFKGYLNNAWHRINFTVLPPC